MDLFSIKEELQIFSGDLITVVIDYHGVKKNVKCRVVDRTDRLVTFNNGYYNFSVSIVDLYYHKPIELDVHNSVER